jgi:hypothetical protein
MKEKYHVNLWESGRTYFFEGVSKHVLPRGASTRILPEIGGELVVVPADRIFELVWGS